MKPLDQRWSIAQAAGLATLLEASAPKLGNVHPAASFSDMHFGHFVTTAAVQSECFSDLGDSVGLLVLRTVQATRIQVGCNTNLGTVLLLAPLAIAADRVAGGNLDSVRLKQVVQDVLRSLSAEDSRLVYQAIREAAPGGLGEQADNDVAKVVAPESLIDAMQQVAQFDGVASQYVNNFADIFDRLLPWLDEELQAAESPLKAIVNLQIRCLSWQPDGLILRKCGFDQAVKVQQLAAELWSAHEMEFFDRSTCEFREGNQLVWLDRLAKFDEYLRADGNRRNPGTTADLIAATLFCRLICGTA
jgi:triphosphoribosyl-dephospho-CoA synthase